MAWKVFNDVEDKDLFMKTIYYPKLTEEDLHILMDKFQEQFKKLNNRNRLSYVLSLGSFVGGWALAYRYRFTFGTFILTSIFSFVGAKLALDRYFNNNMIRNLNNYAETIAVKYPEIKYSKVEFVPSSQVTYQKLY